MLKHKIVSLIVLSAILFSLAGTASASDIQSLLDQKAVPETSSTPFTDVTGHWGANFIMEMNFRGIMNGYQDNSFKPNNPVTQLEALVMLVRMKGYTPAPQEQIDNYLLNDIFKVPGWATPYIDYAIENELSFYKELNGMTLHQPLTRQDAAIMVVRSLGLARQAEKNNAELNFIDADTIAPDATGFIRIAVEKGIINGTAKGEFLPTNPLSRAEIAAMLAKTSAFLPEETIQEITGTLKTVKHDESTVIEIVYGNSNDEEQTITLSGNSLIYRDGLSITADQLITGDSVKVLVKTLGSKIEYFVTAFSKKAAQEIAVQKVSLIPKELEPLVATRKMNEGFYAWLNDNTLYLLACRGEKPNSGYNIEITSVTVTDTRTVTVHYKVSNPLPDRFYLPYINYPFSLVNVRLDFTPTEIVFQNGSGGDPTIGKIERLEYKGASFMPLISVNEKSSNTGVR